MRSVRELNSPVVRRKTKRISKQFIEKVELHTGCIGNVSVTAAYGTESSVK